MMARRMKLPRSAGNVEAYLPGSDERKLRKAFRTNADAVCFDLEDSVANDRKAGARETVLYALNAAEGPAERLVRISSPSSGLARDDLEIILSSQSLQGIVIPKVHSPSDVHFVMEMIEQHAHPDTRDSLKLIASIESARAIMNLKEIATASDHLDSLLFAAEDFCADTGIVRTEDRRELLYARSAVVVAAKAFGLSAIDLVCIHYLDQDSLAEECEEGRKLGFDAKQMIHPAQIDVVQAAFSPSQQAIEKAQTVLAQYKAATEAGKGAYGLAADKHGRAEMIDAPMILQAQRLLAKAAQYGLV
ncbi:citrate lyase beta subunit [Cystobasidium minutum MCA 4210]|uniref:citrate lyase beta subunit n=1 Tax=Cystobasidium minutum MCA 4210 TaxID=1397322 RepID=UPI0034CD3028|eukprot:jgi/Rhomi1/18254/CE18253_2093